MKRYISIILIAITSFTTNQGYSQALDARADSAYTAGDFALATSLYEQTIKESGTSAPLLYNLGNSYYRQGKLSKAVLAYERSLRLNPSDRMARINLEFVNSKLVDKKGYEGSFLSRTFTDITNIMSANAWAWIALLMFAMTASCASIYIFSNGIFLRKIGFFGGISFLILFLITLIFAFNSRRLFLSNDAAIVTAPSSILSTSPRAPQNRNEEAMLLHEGARVTIIDSVKSPVDSIKTVWYDVAFDNDHRAWINSSDVEII